MEGEVTNRDEVVAIELPAPEGWKKRFTPKKGGSGTPKRNEITFISPTGEEIKTKKQLDQYIKSHPDCPSASEFDWGTGDTPRRSARLSEKPKAEESPDSETPKKKQKRSSSKKQEKGKKEEENVDGDAQATEETNETVAAPSEETKEKTQVADGDKVVVNEEIPPAEEEKEEDKAKKDIEEKTHGEDVVTEKVVDEQNIEKEENVATDDAMEEDNTESKSMSGLVVEVNNKEAEKEPVEPEAPITVPAEKDAVGAEIGEECQSKGEEAENAEAAVPPQPAAGGERGDYQSGNYEPKTSQVSC